MDRLATDRDRSNFFIGSVYFLIVQKGNSGKLRLLNTSSESVLVRIKGLRDRISACNVSVNRLKSCF